MLLQQRCLLLLPLLHRSLPWLALFGSYLLAFSVATTPVPLWCDNEACIMVSKDATSLKRLSYITRRVRLLQELTSHGVVVLHKVSGTANPADALTKVLAVKYAFKEYMAKPIRRFF